MLGQRLLIVDDNATNLKLLAYLMRANGYDVDTAVDAESALEAIALCRPDLILMDIQLPDVDGLALTRRLKTAPKTHDIVVIAVTAYAMKGDAQKALAAGCDGYVTKPIDTRALPAEIAQHLANRAAG